MNTAEANVVRLEEENKLKEGYADRVKQMTRSLDQLQKASEKSRSPSPVDSKKSLSPVPTKSRSPSPENAQKSRSASPETKE